MNPYLTLIKTDIRLAFRQKVVIFFNYLMPLAFFFIFAQSFHAEQGGVILQVVTMVTVIGILGNGLFGAGIRAAQDREMNILRRYKVAPISPFPLLLASTVTGLVVYMPYVLIMLALSVWRYGMTMPQHTAAMLIFIMLGVLAIRSIGLMVASVVNSMQESAILVQVIYMTMLFLSGATFPIAMFPNWLVTIAQFIPATWLVTGLQGIMVRNETLAANWQAVGALILTTVLGFFLSVKLFRWEKEEKMRPAAKLWLAAVLLPFVLLGTWQTQAKDNAGKTKILTRDIARSRTVLIRNARIFIGDGNVIANGAVLVKAGKIAEIYDGKIPDPATLNAELIEAAGKTILPGLIDTNVNLAGPAPSSVKTMERNLAAYLYSGVTAVNSTDRSELTAKVRDIVNSGEKEGAELFLLTIANDLNSLSAAEASEQFAAGKTDLLNRSLVQQVAPPELLAETMKAISARTPVRESYAELNNAQDKLLRAYRADRMLIMGTGAGKPLVFHGPSVQHELELWVVTGIRPSDALRAATLNSAKALHADRRIGSIEKGKDATLLVVDGNPLDDIKATEAISFVMFKGERVDRSDLFKE
ncbi:MAG: ABC transporter permease [Bryobacteraceae bacterium]|jgi:ABC-type multidrug transport system permease subunit